MRIYMLILGIIMSQLLFAQKPNVIVIVADDLGNADVGYHQQSKDIPTPNIDELAESGVYFSCGYVTAPVCGPSRAGLLTGNYQQSFGFDDNPGPFRAQPDVLAGIPTDIKIISEYLKPQGYQTACIGKWHVGHEADEYFPTNRGFDYFYGFLGGAASYYPGNNENRTLYKNTRVVKSESRYLTDAFGDEARDYILNARNKPFFMYLAFNAVHGPLQETPDKYKEPFKHIENPKRRTLCAMQYAMDANIGKVLKTLEEEGLRDNTLIFFVSDNGGKIKGNYSYNMPYRGEKGTLYEGGIRLPFCVSWPAKVNGGEEYSEAVSTLDILPTILAATSVNDKNTMVGKDLLPYISGKENGPVHDVLYWRINHRWAIRNNEWKLVNNEANGTPKLFRILSDRSESENLYEKYPEVVKALEEEYQAWSDKMGPKLWGWSPTVGKYVHHPDEDFEGINTEQFLPQPNRGQLAFVDNPLRQGLNKSDNVLKIMPYDSAESDLSVLMKTSVFQRRKRYLSLKIKAVEQCLPMIEIKGKKGKATSIQPMETFKANGQWQILCFDCQAFKGAVSQISFTFQSTKKPLTEAIFLDDIHFKSKPD
ncbi:sulfatase family protein [Carboxylicivirga sp. RSCT41]|uniref:sulfatase family protein n=1 Tax=Carboxylicivirga agarovorans TaxID=3417570 RepID=UPI003D347F8D